MSGHVTELSQEKIRSFTSAELAQVLAKTDFSRCSVTIIGFGRMGAEYLKALDALSVKKIRVVGRSSEGLEKISCRPEIERVAGGFESFMARPDSDDLAIVALPTALLVPATRRLVGLGFRRLLIEKPVSLRSLEIEQLEEECGRKGVAALCAYNRVAYPSFLECRSRLEREGGATSCVYAFTELISSDWEWIFPADELARWGVSNCLHPIGMAHRLIGMPRQWSGQRKGSLSWHPSGSVFVGSGLSEAGVPFSYHADWGSTGRWSVEVHTAFSSYRLCPLEKLTRRVEARADWVEVPISLFAPGTKTGLTEEVAAALDPGVRERVPLYTLSESARLTRFAEELFGYER